MKKSIIFFVGLALLTSAVIPFSSASRNAYHAYITADENKSKYRHHTEGRRLSSTNSYRVTQQAERNGARFARHSRRTFSVPKGVARVSDTNTTYETSLEERKNTQIRPFATRAGIAPRQNLRATGRYSRIAPSYLPQLLLSFETYKNENFSVEIPARSVASVTDKHTFEVGDMEVRIKRFDASTCYKSFGFRGCASNISGSENAALVEGKGRLISIDRIIRQNYKTDTVLSEPNVQSNVYTEDFSAYFADGEVYTLYRYAVEEPEGGVYFIEAKVPRAQAREYVGIANRIFDSFRLYTQKP